MTTRTTVLAAVFLAALTPALAQAHNWFILDAQTNKCVPASKMAVRSGLPALISPYETEKAARLAARLEGNFAGLNPIRDKGGNLVAVGVEVGTPPLVIVFFRNAGTCALISLTRPSPTELK